MKKIQQPEIHINLKRKYKEYEKHLNLKVLRRLTITKP